MTRRLRRDERGVTLVEFGLVSPVLILMLMALIDLGFRSYVGMQLQGTLDQAARKVTVGSVSASTVNSFVQQRMTAIIRTATVAVTEKNYDNFSRVGKPEPITTDIAPIGTYNKGDCFLDLNGNGTWDSDSGASGSGGGDDIVYYTATVSFPALMPLGRLLGWPTTETVSATMMMRNQPYSAQATPPTVCS